MARSASHCALGVLAPSERGRRATCPRTVTPCQRGLVTHFIHCSLARRADRLSANPKVPCVLTAPHTHACTRVLQTHICILVCVFLSALNTDHVHIGWEEPLSRGQDLGLGHLHTAASLGQLGPPLPSIGMSSGPTAGR